MGTPARRTLWVVACGPKGRLARHRWPRRRLGSCSHAIVTDLPVRRASEVALQDEHQPLRSAAMCAITTASGCNGACRLLRSAGDLVAESEHIPNLHY